MSLVVSWLVACHKLPSFSSPCCPFFSASDGVSVALVTYTLLCKFPWVHEDHQLNWDTTGNWSLRFDIVASPLLLSRYGSAVHDVVAEMIRVAGQGGLYADFRKGLGMF